ncbi:hypothetical protein NT6N_16710 [Oceaniferula spumae]|uniref:Non-specific serine/threonine protein kinase n=1 Tax=Oceaniferula spumae TaxID=2979115 RepID=A0AAT9FL17_9BACT
MENTEPTIQFQAPTLEELVPLFPAYDIEAFIAQGGMGAVYQARQISLDRPVAIKILPREFGADPEFRASFEAEAKAMARLNHPNLIGVYDFGDIDGMLYLVMELVHGKSLYHSCYGKAIDPAQAAEIIISICQGIDHAHNADILHRDIKPANILLSQDATPKIGDFGLAAPMNQAANPEDVIYGTPGYTAPEVINRQPVDRRADIFSIGVMLHQLLTGQMPDANRTAPSTISACPMAYDAIVARSTQPNPQLRYSSAAELADALTKVSSQSAPRLNVPVAAGPVRPMQPVVAKKKSPALALSLLALAAVGGIAFIATQKKPADTTTQTPIEPKPTEETTKPAPVSTFPTKPVEAASVVTAPDPTPRKKDPLKQLGELKDALANGARDKFPDGTVEKNGSHFLYLKHPLSWQAAQRFAEEHGAHLAVIADPEDRKWLMRQFETSDPTWIGAGLAANDAWQWLDGSEWNTADRPTSPSKPTVNDGYLAISSSGALISQSKDENRPIMLQWRDDGSNPCTIEAQLKRTTASIEKNGLDKAIYPVGTRTHSKSHFLLLDKKLSWDKARELAVENKGQLAVPSSPVENEWLAQTFSNKDKTTSFWIGGYLLTPTSPWQWLTKEAWHSSGWKSGQPSKDTAQNRMLMTLESASDARAWSSSDGDAGDASVTLIEWSQPKQTSTAGTFDLDKWLASVNRKIADRVKPDVAEYKKDRDQLVDKYIRSMKRAAKKVDVPGGGRGGRGGRGGWGQERIINLVDEAMEKVEQSGELPDSLPEFAPSAFHEIHKESKTALKTLDDAYQAKLKAHMEFYAKGLLGKITDLTSDGFVQQANELQDTVKSLGDDTSKFLGTLNL